MIFATKLKEEEGNEEEKEDCLLASQHWERVKVEAVSSRAEWSDWRWKKSFAQDDSRGTSEVKVKAEAWK